MTALKTPDDTQIIILLSSEIGSKEKGSNLQVNLDVYRPRADAERLVSAAPAGQLPGPRGATSEIVADILVVVETRAIVWIVLCSRCVMAVAIGGGVLWRG
jgi:hypothetical protein